VCATRYRAVDGKWEEIRNTQPEQRPETTTTTRFERLCCAIATGLLAAEGQGENGTWPTAEAFAVSVVKNATALERAIEEHEKENG